MSKIEAFKDVTSTGKKRHWYARIDGQILRKSNGCINRFGSATAAQAGAQRELERLRRLAVHQASQMPEASA